MSAAGAWLRRHRTVTVLVVAVLATIAVLTALSAGSATYGGDLDPQNPGPEGAQAVARVLSDHGVHVDVVRRAAAFEDATVDSDTTVLVTSSGALGDTTAHQVAVHAAAAGAVVLAAPVLTLVRALRLPVAEDTARVRSDATAGCDDPLLSGLSLDVGTGGVGYRARSGAAVTSCFSGSGSEPAALVVRVDRPAPTYAVGGDALFTNHRVKRADNAAAALRMLGQHDRLVWYVPDLRDVAVGDDGSFAAQLPRGLVASLWLMLLAVLATMLWRGRRLGPLVVEPLPVVVKAVESTRGRGRLYRRVRDRDHAASILRAATLRRLGARLRLPGSTDRDRLLEAVAARLGRDPGLVRDVLVARPVEDDRALTRLARDLAALEEEVRHP